MKIRLLVKLLILMPFFSHAQLKGTINGILINTSNHKKSINYGTISIYENDSSLVSYKLSDSKGTFAFTGLQIGKKYNVIVTAFQYNTLRKDIYISNENQNINLDSLFLEKKINSLNEVVVLAERPPIIVRNDTIEFNAESFKTLPTAFVEDLLKKLNGVVIDRNGNISFNGKAVNRILVDGKDYFDGKIQIASKNLPANIVDKVQIMDDLDYKRQNIDDISKNIPQVINLTLKKNIKQGGFGKLYAGMGINNYYEVGGIMNLFRDTSQVSILGYSNNVSKSAFTLGEIQTAGGFDRSGYNSLSTGNGGSFSIDNVSFGGYGEGVQKPSGAGANFNTLTKGGIKINTKYFYGKINAYVEQKGDENQIISNNIVNTQKVAFTRNNIESHNISSKFVYNPNLTTRITLNPSIELSPRDYQTIQVKNVRNGTDQLISESKVDNNRDLLNKAFKLNGDFSKDFNKKGRRLFTTLTLLLRDNNEDYLNSSSINFTSPGNNQLTDQLRAASIENMEFGFRGSYAEPISKKLKLSIGFKGRLL